MRIGGEEIELEIGRSEGVATVALGDRTERADLVRIGSSAMYSLILGNHSYELSMHRTNGQYEIVLLGETYTARVMDERALRIAAASGMDGETSTGETIKAPMPGVVVRIASAVGDTILPGQGVLTLEAMKMENELKSAAGGVVREIKVEVGQGVTLGEALLVIE